jgi:UDP-N-acetylglucosamine--N-acetylmuramyl-(pentapeptide) pyrophosphoryl-undecaprenol N-acetylglucosamine transferase
MSDVTNSTTVFLAGGGTGGHLYPGIAVAEALVRARQDVRPVFLCTTRDIDRAILEPAGFEFIAQPIYPLVRSIGGLLRFWKGWRETKDLIRRILPERKPGAIVGLGGYAAGVAVRTATQKGIPAAILNPDVIPGRANQFLMRQAQVVCCQFEATREHVSDKIRAKLQITGCPIRSDIRELPPREQAASRLALNPRVHTLVITGASQGAQTVNEAVIETLASVKLQGWQILHLSGKEHAEKVRAEYRERNIPAGVIDFTPAMADVWAVADLAVCRAGASTCAELTACGVPSILMPYPFHKDMHQRANAKVLEETGAAVLLDDEKDRKRNAAKLRPILEPLLYDATRRTAMADAARALGKPDAAEAVAQVVTQMLAAGR